MSGKRIRAAIYSRYSSHNQREVSITDQNSAGMELMKRMGWDFAGYYSDSAKTATNDKRKDFKRLMNDAEADVYDIVIIWHTDRVHRNMLNGFIMLARLFAHGKDFYSINQPELNEDGEMRLLLYALYAWKDERYSIDLSHNVKRGQKSNAERCHPNGQLRYGWNIIGARIDQNGKYHPGDHYEINRHEAEAARAMFHLRARGFTWTAIASKLNEKGYRNKYGRSITGAMVAGIVRNEAYKGFYMFGDVRIEGGIPSIVSDAEWNAAQDGRRRKSVKHRKHIYIRPEMKFGQLQVIEEAGKARHHTKWLCECRACGATKVEWGTRLTSGKAKDCGCLSGDGRERDKMGQFA